MVELLAGERSLKVEDDEISWNSWDGVVFILAFSLLVSIISPTIQDQDTPVAKQGVLDLSRWDFEKQGLVDLDGEWEFYENKLLSPSEIQQSIDKKSTYLSVPGTWKGKIIEDGMDRKGAGTYRLKVLVKDSDEILGLKIRSIRMSQKLFINGKQEGEDGVPSTESESFKPEYSVYGIFHSNTQEIEIVIQVSNFNFITGGS